MMLAYLASRPREITQGQFWKLQTGKMRAGPMLEEDGTSYAA